MKAEELWSEFIKKHPEYEDDEYMAWAYGSAPEDRKSVV